MSVEGEMVDARRFPRLELPFAVVGAAGGFLSAGLLANRLIAAMPRDMQLPTAIVAAIVAGAAGTLVRKLCIGRRYAYGVEEHDEHLRASTDRNAVHALVVALSGGLVGAIIGEASGLRYGMTVGALDGVGVSAVSVPVILSVLAAARRAQRARLGTLVASSDRRRIWSILATALALTTLEGIVDWVALPRHAATPPTLAIIIAMACGVVILVTLLADMREQKRVEVALADLAPAPVHVTDAPALVDLGLGEEVGARIAMSGSAYRGCDRTVALVRGDPVAVRLTMTAAIRRGHASIALVAIVLGAHMLGALSVR